MPRIFSSRPRARHFSATRRTGQPVKSGTVKRGTWLINVVPDPFDGELDCSRFRGVAGRRGNKDPKETDRRDEVAASALSDS